MVAEPAEPRSDVAGQGRPGVDDNRLGRDITLKLLCEALWRRGEVFNPLAITAFTIRGKNQELAVSTAKGFRKLRFDQSRFRSIAEPRTRTLWG